ncbi:protein phosphatase CheZ [Aromatoleum petrolei]|uniref:Protein phosphatase CheZ n=1 Tax=Aromatoleum petrolei TaxID=76116 RepID=A0ABX1MQA6_9RHOO|nr:protein phosphatase CheZ [Aromatoleum petrolei]NMF88891.1 protein phosphatase CheZ [Aromatoleum petrolei]QTQ37750.1 Chemotaxis protein, CheZ [Aromatoleum petrolei]
MAKKLKQDEVGDSDELQALFDSIANTQAQPAPAARPAPAPAPAASGDSGGDDAELQALFDSVAADFEAGFVATEPAASVAPAAQPEHSCDAVFTRIGQMTRQVHDTLRELGTDDGLQDAVQAIPDARQRLTYIAQMTEQAASRVLNATDIAQPIQNRIQSGASDLHSRWDRLFANQLSVDEFKALSAETRSFLGEVVDGSRATNAQLMEIMMAQDFQDLTGQVIKKVVELAQKLETELLQVLLEVTPAGKRGDKHSGLMNGPVVSAEGRDDVVTTQEQVDDLLDSLGF